jgi:DNA-binding transcriptional LysR family regulator
MNDGVELRHLRTFVAVAETLHFGRAAERLHLAQPAVSQQVRRLEASVGVPLFARDRRRTALTEAGRALLPEARATLAHAAAATAAARAAARGQTGHLRIGLAPTAHAEPVLAALGTLRRDAPDVRVTVGERRMGELVDALRRGGLDLAVLAVLEQPPAGRGLATRPVASDPFVAALPAAHPLAAAGPVDLAALAAEPFVVFARDQGARYHDTLRDLCRAAGFTPAEQEVRELPTQLALVAAGLGVALVPASVAALRAADVAYVPLAGPAPQLHTLLSWREDGDAPLLQRVLALVPAA